MPFILEICADSVESALIAQQSGAQRIELCGDLPEGGITPGPGKILSVRSNLDIPLHVIIRPRGSDFLYSDAEYDEMRRDIEFCGEAGADGVVLGILLSDGNIDVERCARLVELAQPMSVTFHRAFDLCIDPLKGLKDVISTGSDRLLTSGQANSAMDGADLIATLVKLSAGRISVMPGGGITEDNIASVVRSTGAMEFHLTGRRLTESDMEFRRKGVEMGGSLILDEYKRKVADRLTISKIAEILKMI